MQMNFEKSKSKRMRLTWQFWLVCTALTFAMVPAKAQSNGTEIPDRMIVKLLNIDLCEYVSRSVSELESLVARVLSKHAIVLQRGEVQDAIEREQLESMGVQFNENRTAEFGAMEGAQAIVSVSFDCRNQVQILTVNITSVETTRLLYTNSFNGVDLNHVFRLFEMDFDLAMKKGAHPLSEFSEDQLRTNIFELELVDFQFSDSWNRAIEQSLFSGLLDFRSNKHLAVEGVAQVRMSSDEFGMMHVHLELKPAKSRELTEHLQLRLNDVTPRVAPKYGQRTVLVQAQPNWSFTLETSPRETVLLTKRSSISNSPWHAELSTAPSGKYVFQSHAIRLGIREFSSVELLEGKGRNEITAMALSAVLPGVGVSYGTFGNERWGHHLLAVGSLASIAAVTRLLSRTHYAQYQNATTELEASTSYSTANLWHHVSLISSGCALVSWSWNLADTYRKSRAHNRRIQLYMSNL